MDAVAPWHTHSEVVQRFDKREIGSKAAFNYPPFTMVCNTSMSCHYVHIKMRLEIKPTNYYKMHMIIFALFLSYYHSSARFIYVHIMQILLIVYNIHTHYICLVL